MTTAHTASSQITVHTTRTRGRSRRAGAALLTGSLFTAILGLSTPATASASTATLVDWGNGPSVASAWGGRGPGSYDDGSETYGSAGTTHTGTVDSEPATAAESKGVAVIDTVLTDGEAAGTGIVLTSDGEVLTNYHVVEGSTSVKVTLPSSGRSYTATVVGADQTADVALLQLKDASGLTVAKIDDDTLKTGDDVTAVGNAGGTGTLTAAQGDVTDLSASITTQSEDSVQGESLAKLIETTADVVAGDSGGPLLDSEGEVVGIDTAASSGQDIDGYAVPIATALRVVTQIRSGDETAEVRIGAAAFLGVQVAVSVSEDSAYGYGYGDSASTADGSGVVIAGVVDGDAAEEAGIAAGATIVKVGSTSVTDAADLTKALASMEPGDKVSLTWTDADGATQSATVTLDASPIN